MRLIDNDIIPGIKGENFVNVYLLFEVLQGVLRIVSSTHAIYDSMWPPIQQLTVLDFNVVSHPEKNVGF